MTCRSSVGQENAGFISERLRWIGRLNCLAFAQWIPTGDGMLAAVKQRIDAAWVLAEVETAAVWAARPSTGCAVG